DPMHYEAVFEQGSVDIRKGVEAEGEPWKEVVEPEEAVMVMITIEIAIPVPAMSHRHHAAAREIAAMKGRAAAVAHHASASAVAHHSPAAAVAHHSAAAAGVSARKGRGRRRNAEREHDGGNKSDSRSPA